MSNDIQPMMCVQCEQNGRERQSIMTFIVAEKFFRLCERCAAELLVQLDSKLAIWADETGGRVVVGPEPKTWEGIGITIPPDHKKGFVAVDCPDCKRKGAVVADLDNGTATCRMCDYSDTVDV